MLKDSAYAFCQRDAGSMKQHQLTAVFLAFQFQSLIHSFQPLQPFFGINFQFPVLIPPSVIRLLGDLEMLTHDHHLATSTKHKAVPPVYEQSVDMPSLYIVVLLGH